MEFEVKVTRSPISKTITVASSFPYADINELYIDLRQVEDTIKSSDEAGRDFGKILFLSVFRHKVLDLYRKSCEAAEKERKRIRLKISSSKPFLATLPWELLFDPDPTKQSFLSLESPIIRGIESNSYATKPQLPDSKIRILAILPDPIDLPEIDVSEEQRSLEEALLPAIRSKKVELKWITDGSLDTLRHELKEEWHIFHYAGFTFYDKERDAEYLAFKDPEAFTEPVLPQQLAKLLQKSKSLSLAVLATGGRIQLYLHGTDYQDGVALALAKKIPTVIAMQYELGNSIAREFTHTFYGYIADGFTIDESLVYTRRRLQIKNEWANPVCYSQFDPAETFEALAPPVLTSPAKLLHSNLSTSSRPKILFLTSNPRRDLKELFNE